jgi:hypothetical protein
MPLDWEMVKKRYVGKKVSIPYIRGGKKFTVTGVTDTEIFVSTLTNPKAPIKRQNLERMVMLIETKRVKMDRESLTDDYRTLVEDNRATSSISILLDLGIVK